MNMITQSFGAIDPGRAADRRGSHDSFVAGPIVVCKCHPAFESVTRLGDSSHRIQYWEEHVPAASVEMQGHAVRFQFFIICPGTVDSSEQGPRVAANAETEFGQSANSRLHNCSTNLSISARQRQIGRKKAGNGPTTPGDQRGVI